jgi:hypothetical protein
MIKGERFIRCRGQRHGSRGADLSDVEDRGMVPGGADLSYAEDKGMVLGGA